MPSYKDLLPIKHIYERIGHFTMHQQGKNAETVHPAGRRSTRRGPGSC